MTKDEFLAKLKSLDIMDGNVDDSDSIAIMELAKIVAEDNCLFLDVGSWKGKSTACLAVVAAHYNGKVFCVDHWQGSPNTRGEQMALHSDIFSTFKVNMKLISAWQNIVFPLLMPLDKALPILRNHQFDLIFLDLDNMYQEVYWNIRNCLDKLKHGGYLR